MATFVKLSQAGKAKLGLSKSHTYYKNKDTGAIFTKKQHEKAIIRARNLRLKAQRIAKKEQKRIEDEVLDQKIAQFSARLQREGRKNVNEDEIEKRAHKFKRDWLNADIETVDYKTPSDYAIEDENDDLSPFFYH